MPLLSRGILIFFFLILIVVGVLWLTRRFEKNPVFKFLPAPLWCYFLPMLASWVGVIPHEHVLYPALSKHLLPACLILLLAGAHLRGIWRLGPVALLAMLAGTLAIILGGPLLFFLFKPWLPPDAWMGLGALSASWTGGSVNMIAVKEAIGTPESLFSVMVIVDSMVCYVWMGIVIELSTFQAAFDRWNRSNMQWLKKVGGASGISETPEVPGSWLLAPVLVGFAFGELAIILAERLSSGGGITNASTWAVLFATTIGIALSFVKTRRFNKKQAEKLGYFLLYLLLTSIGARADLAGIFQAPIYLIFGVSWVLVMGVVLFGVGRIFRIPLFFLAAASQANVGGTASATIVAAVYQPHLAFVGLLLAILGNVFGTYLGIAASYLMKWVAGG